MNCERKLKSRAASGGRFFGGLERTLLRVENSENAAPPEP